MNGNIRVRRKQGQSIRLAPILIFMVLGLILCPTCASAAKRQYCYTSAVVAEGQTTPYEPTQTRCDVVWTGDHVVVDTVLNTNGGDLIIFAETVTFNAPVDTRPYFTLRKAFYPSYVYPPDNNWLETTDALPEVLKSYTDLLFWREYYDPADKVWKFSVSGPHVQLGKLDDNRLTSPYSAPQLPGALFPRFGLLIENGVRGNDAPTPAAEARHSGNVLIVANKIEFCDKCIEPYPDTQLPTDVADYHDVQRRRFIITAGVKGGLGSPGTQTSCFGKSASCFGWDFQPISGHHGGGGDAGSVHIVTYGEDGSAGKNEWGPLIDATSGYPPFAGRLQTRSHAALTTQPNRSNSAFARLSAEGEFQLGESGQVSLETRRPLEEGLSLIQTRLAHLMLYRRYDPQSLVTEIQKRIGQDEEVLLPSDVLGRQLMDFRRDILLGLIQRANVEWGGDPTGKMALPHLETVTALSCDSASRLMISGGVQVEVAAMCDMQDLFRHPERSERTFVAHTGGLLRHDPTSFSAERYDSLAMLQRLERLQGALQLLAFDTQSIIALLDEANVREDVTILKANVERVQARIGALEQIRASKSDQLGNIINSAIQGVASAAVPGMGSIISLINQASATNDPSRAAELYQKADSMGSDLFVEVGKSFLPILKSPLGGDAPASQASNRDIANARTEMANTLRAIGDLQTEAASRKEQRLTTLGAAAASVLNERQALVSDYRASVDAFEPLYKYALFEGLADATDTEGRTRSRLAAVQTYLQSYGKVSLPITFAGVKIECQGKEYVQRDVRRSGPLKLSDCVVLRNKVNRPVQIVTASNRLGPIVLMSVSVGSSVRLNLRGMNLPTDNRGQTVLLVQ